MKMENTPDESFCLFGAEAVLKRLEALEQEINGVCKADDIECVHRMRVASRRLRSTFAIFEECLRTQSNGEDKYAQSHVFLVQLETLTFR